MKKTVLFVDDDAVLCRSVQHHSLKQSDRLMVITAQNGAEAIEILSRQPVALVITDLQMPEMDGFELLARMSIQYPEVPVMIVTAFGSSEMRQRGLSEGAVGFIEKPFEVAGLMGVIVETLDAQTEGGAFQAVPLETMAQLIEMAHKSCTLRVTEKITQERGVLFFRDGELVDARCNEAEGVPAAVDVFGWDFVKMDIEESLPEMENRIDGGLNAVLELVAHQRV